MTQDEDRAGARKTLDERETLLSEGRQIARRARSMELALLKLAMNRFNAESEPINGITAELRELNLGEKCCHKSPVCVCVYGDVHASLMSLPAQRGEPVEEDCGCIFCGEPYPVEKKRRR